MASDKEVYLNEVTGTLKTSDKQPRLHLEIPGKDAPVGTDKKKDAAAGGDAGSGNVDANVSDSASDKADTGDDNTEDDEAYDDEDQPIAGGSNEDDVNRAKSLEK